MFRIGISADFEQRANKRQRAVINGVLEATSYCKRHRAVRYTLLIFHRRSERFKVADTKGRVDLPESVVLRTPIELCVHYSQGRIVGVLIRLLYVAPGFAALNPTYYGVALLGLRTPWFGQQAGKCPCDDLGLDPAGTTPAS